MCYDSTINAISIGVDKVWVECHVFVSAHTPLWLWEVVPAKIKYTTGLSIFRNPWTWYDGCKNPLQKPRCFLSNKSFTVCLQMRIRVNLYVVKFLDCQVFIRLTRVWKNAAIGIGPLQLSSYVCDPWRWKLLQKTNSYRKLWPVLSSLMATEVIIMITSDCTNEE